MGLEASQPLKLSLEAAGDLSAGQYLFVKIDANGRAAVVAALADIPIGVLQNKPKAIGQMAEIVVIGITKLVAGGSITAGASSGGAAIGSGSAGKARAAVVNTTAGYVTPTTWAVGTAIPMAAGATAIANNDVFEALVNCSIPLQAT